MTKVSLRVYNREIEGMIEGGKLEEAIAHCQQILTSFPMHVETYRLLGKSLLEARRYTDAADIFQRALMTVPDDFVVHVGMSIIRDDEGKLDDAIWHMERAFESQSANPAIQAELRRLYGRRDGVEPPKIRLSRDALANMYVRGELFNQAIAEIRAVLAEDANRPDLQVMLARAYYHSGQKVKAAEIAADLLKKFTYCMDALRILVDVLPGSAGTENTQIYRSRLRLLDPYTSFATGSVFLSDQVPDTAVILERLEYNENAVAASPQLNWASSLGIKLADEKHAEPVPDWMSTGDSAEESIAIAPVSTEPAIPEDDDKSIPNWMSTGVWQESGVKAPESPVGATAEQPTEQLAKADIPDWVRAMAPQEITGAEVGSEPVQSDLTSSSSGDIPDWLARIGSSTTDENAGSEPASTIFSSLIKGKIPDLPSGESTGAAEANDGSKQTPGSLPSSLGLDIPDWLKKTEIGTDEANTRSGPTPANVPTSSEANTPGWLGEPGTVAAEASDEPSPSTIPFHENSAFPEWLKGMRENASAGAVAAFAADGLEQPSTDQPQTSTEPVPPPPEDLAPNEFASALRDGEDVAFRPTGESKPLNIDDEPMAWLESLAAKQGAKEGDLLTKPGDRSDDIPDWLRPDYPQPSTPTTLESSVSPIETKGEEPLTMQGGESKAQESAISEDLPTELSPIEGTVQPLNIEDDTMAWLEGLAADPGAKEEVSLTKPEDHSEEIPEWLRSSNEQPSALNTAESPELRETLPLEAFSPPAGESDATNKTFSDEFPSSPEKEFSDIPGWLRSGNEQPVSSTTLKLSPAGRETVPLEAESLDAGEFAAQQKTPSDEIPTALENELEDVPVWLRSADEQVPTPGAPDLSSRPSETPSLDSFPLPISGEWTEGGSAPTEEFPTHSAPPEGGLQPIEEDVALAWLKDLEAKQSEKPDDSQTNPLENPETLPGLIQETDQVSAPAYGTSASDIQQEDITIKSWLRKQDVDETLGKNQTSGEVLRPEVVPLTGVPDWLKELEKPTTPTEAPRPAEDLPDWLRQPAQPSERGMASIQTPESTPKPELPDWSDEEIPVSERTSATSPGEWVPVEDKPVPVPDIELVNEQASFAVETPIERRVLGGTGMLARIPAQDKDSDFLVTAQAALDASQLNEAMQAYIKLIKKKRLLDEVIHDLREAIYRFPVDIIVWQTLGDACMRANRLQDALDAYTKAEELLR